MLSVTRIVSLNGRSESDLLRLVAAAEVGSEHPLGEAIVSHAREMALDLPRVEQFESITGQGIRANVEDHELVIGNNALMQATGLVNDHLADCWVREPVSDR